MITFEIKSKNQDPNFQTIFYQHPIDIINNFSILGFCIGGFLVGFGTKLGNGCTSGHGLCGMPRFSKRSWVSVIIFFSVAVLTANLLNASNLSLDKTQPWFVTSDFNHLLYGGVCGLISLLFLIISGVFYVKASVKYYDLFVSGNPLI